MPEDGQNSFQAKKAQGRTRFEHWLKKKSAT